MSYVHPGLTYFLSNYGPLFNLCNNWISAGDQLPDRRPETRIARRKSCSLAGSKAWPQRLDDAPGPSNGPYRVTPHLTSPWQRPGHSGMTFDRSLYSASDSVVRSDLLRTDHSYLRRSTPSWPSPSPRSVLIYWYRVRLVFRGKNRYRLGRSLWLESTSIPSRCSLAIPGTLVILLTVDDIKTQHFHLHLTHHLSGLPTLALNRVKHSRRTCHWTNSNKCSKSSISWWWWRIVVYFFCSYCWHFGDAPTRSGISLSFNKSVQLSFSALICNETSLTNRQCL